MHRHLNLTEKLFYYAQLLGKIGRKLTLSQLSADRESAVPVSNSVGAHTEPTARLAKDAGCPIPGCSLSSTYKYLNDGRRLHALQKYAVALRSVGLRNDCSRQRPYTMCSIGGAEPRAVTLSQILNQNQNAAISGCATRTCHWNLNTARAKR